MTTATTQKPKQRRAASQKLHRGVLGINVTSETIEAALLKQTGDRISVIKRFSRPRIAVSHLGGATSLATVLPGLKSSEDADYTLQVGDGATGATDFVPAEFSNFGTRSDSRKAAEEIAAQSQTHPFSSQLKEILQECKALGFGHVDLAFCLAPPDVNYVELKLPLGEIRSGTKSKARGRKQQTEPDGQSQSATTDEIASRPLSAADVKRLLQILPEHHPGTIEAERVAFVPLTSTSEHRRILAIVGDPTDPVGSTLKLLHERSAGGATTTPRFVNAEASTYLALFERNARPEASERSAIIRVGSEDTLVLFFEGTALSHIERLRSLSVFDLPETICSRVILQQDEKKIGDIHSLYLVDGSRSDKLLSAFRQYFPDAAVEPFKGLFGNEEFELPESEEEPIRGAVLPAISVALAGVQQWPQALRDNLLPRELSKKQRAGIGFEWHTLAAGLLVAVLLFVGIGRFVLSAQQIQDEREDLRLNPPTLPPENPDLLQLRVDSLANAYTTYTRALNVLDSLLVGSDQWIQSLALVNRTVTSAGNTWLTKWTPENGALRLNGSSLSRLSIADLSRRLDAAIEQVTFEDIGNRRVFNFEMVTVIPAEMPSASLYLRGTLPPEEFEDSELILHASPPIGEVHSH